MTFETLYASPPKKKFVLDNYKRKAGTKRNVECENTKVAEMRETDEYEKLVIRNNTWKLCENMRRPTEGFKAGAHLCMQK